MDAPRQKQRGSGVAQFVEADVGETCPLEERREAALTMLCLILMFAALGLAANPFVLLVAYGIATTLAAIPLTPGGIGVFEATMLATLALLGVGSEAAIPILGYRLFKFWLPIPLAAVFYPTLRHSGQDHSLGRG